MKIYIVNTLNEIDDMEQYEEYTLLPLDELKNILKSFQKETTTDPEPPSLEQDQEPVSDKENNQKTAPLVCPNCQSEFQVILDELEGVWECPKCGEKFELEYS